MQRKVSTQLDEALFRRARLEAVRQGRPISAIIGEALRKYLDESGTPAGLGGAVAASWGVLSATPRDVVAIMREEDDFLGS